MKINKKDPNHWLYLAKSGTYMLASIVLRPFWRSKGKKRITLYGHKYNGNLKTFAEYALKKGDYTITFVTLDPAYYKELQTMDCGVEFLFLQNFKDVLKVSKSAAVVSDRRAHVLVYYLYLTNIPFFDVWHGIQVFKKFAPKDMAMLKRYREMWIPSEALVDVYVNDYGIAKEKIVVTGYGRVDPLVNGEYKPKELKKKYGIPAKFSKIILLAPTWQQDDPSRQIIPFGEDPDTFLEALDTAAKKLNALIIFRAHLNTNAHNRSKLRALENIKVMSHNDYPLSEEFLAFADIFIGDWSSIAFEYLPLHRPAIFLDVPIPFSEGLTFGIENRYGEVVSSLDALVKAIDTYGNKPEQYMKKHGKQVAKTEEIAYGSTLDGKANQRYYERLQAYLNK